MSELKKHIIFLHGALGVESDLKELMNYFKDNSFELLSFNFHGHGTSGEWPKEFRIELFAQQLEMFFKKNNLHNTIVFGHSLGGYVGLYHQCHFPDSPITQIITYGTKFNWSPQTLTRELSMLNPDHLIEKFPHFVESLKKKHADRWKLLLLSTAHMMQNLERLDGLNREDLEDIHIPVTLVLGDQDRMVSTEETHQAASQLRHCQVKTLSHSKHELERSNLKELFEIVLHSIEQN